MPLNKNPLFLQVKHLILWAAARIPLTQFKCTVFTLNVIGCCKTISFLSKYYK